MNKKSILIITSEFPPNAGGIGNHAYHLATSLKREGYQVTVMTDLVDLNTVEIEKFALQQTFLFAWITRSRMVFLTYLQRFSKAFSLVKINDVVICSGKSSLWLAAILKVRYPRKKFLAVVHGSELDLRASLPKKMTSYALTKFNSIVSVSLFTKNFLPENLPANICKKVIHNGIDDSEFVSVTRQSLSGNPALVTVGSVTERKGQENVIDAMPAILMKFPGAQYHVLGKPCIQSRLQQKVNALDIAGLVHFHGALSRIELLQKFSGATIKLMLSNHTNDGDFEGFGIAILEANALGIPAIGSRNSGIAEAVEHGKTGLLVDPKNPNEIMEAIGIILNNYDEFSMNAKQWAADHDWKKVIREYIPLVEH